MTWEQLGAIGELVSGLAVLVTLIYLAAQIRQAKHLMLSNAHQARTDRNISIMHFLANDDQALQISVDSLVLEDLSPEQRYRAMVVFSSTLRHFEDMQYQHELGLIEEETWNANLDGLVSLTATDTSHELWQECKHMFRKPFVDLVDSIAKGAA
jgi:hypothetical protein